MILCTLFAKLLSKRSALALVGLVILNLIAPKLHADPLDLSGQEVIIDISKKYFLVIQFQKLESGTLVAVPVDGLIPIHGLDVPFGPNWSKPSLEVKDLQGEATSIAPQQSIKLAFDKKAAYLDSFHEVIVNIPISSTPSNIKIKATLVHPMVGIYDTEIVGKSTLQAKTYQPTAPLNYDKIFKESAAKLLDYEVVRSVNIQGVTTVTNLIRFFVNSNGDTYARLYEKDGSRSKDPFGKYIEDIKIYKTFNTIGANQMYQLSPSSQNENPRRGAFLNPKTGEIQFQFVFEGKEMHFEHPQSSYDKVPIYKYWKISLYKSGRQQSSRYTSTSLKSYYFDLHFLGGYSDSFSTSHYLRPLSCKSLFKTPY